MKKKSDDPLLNPDFKEPGILEMLRETLLGSKRQLDCLQVEVTSHCAGQCLYCPHTTKKDKWTPRHMDAATFAKLWPLLQIAGRAHLQGWGEPLLHPRFFDFVALARKSGAEVSTTTSGLGLDAAKARQLLESGLDFVAFSLVGTDAQSNSARAHVPFELTCQAIELLKQARTEAGSPGAPAIHLAYLLLADRVESARDLPLLMEKLDVDTAVVSTLDYLAEAEHASLAFNPHERAKICHAADILAEAAEKAKTNGRQIYYSLPAEEPVAYECGCRENVMRTLYVNTEGEISPCVYLNVQGEEERRKVYGNVNEANPLDIWHDLDYEQFRNRLYCGHPDKVCLACPKRFEKIY